MVRKNEFNAFLMREARKQGIKVKTYDENLEYIEISKNGKSYLMYGGVVSDRSSASATILCRHKYFTYKYLQKNRYPVLPKVKTSLISKVNKFLVKYNEIVIKPTNQKQGRGITVGITSRQELKKAWELAREFSNFVVAEKHFDGDDIRVLVVNYKEVFAVKRIPAYVVGNGRSVIENLIKAKNKKGFPGKRWKKIEIDDAMRLFLRKNKLKLKSVPGKDEMIVLRGTANIHTGGEAHDITDELPSEIKKESIRLAKQLKLPVIGVDYLVSEDYRKRYIIEINADPGVKLHHNPVVGKKRNPTKVMLDGLFEDRG